jgi:hypothetical protein
MVWNWEIFDDKLINVVQSLASNASRHFARGLTHEVSAFLSTFLGMLIFAAPDALQRVGAAIVVCGLSFRIFQLA